MPAISFDEFSKLIDDARDELLAASNRKPGRHQMTDKPTPCPHCAGVGYTVDVKGHLTSCACRKGIAWAKLYGVKKDEQ